MDWCRQVKPVVSIKLAKSAMQKLQDNLCFHLEPNTMAGKDKQFETALWMYKIIKSWLYRKFSFEEWSVLKIFIFFHVNLGHVCELGVFEFLLDLLVGKLDKGIVLFVEFLTEYEIVLLA